MATAIVLASTLLAAVLVVLLIREIRIRRGLQFLLERLLERVRSKPHD